MLHSTAIPLSDAEWPALKNVAKSMQQEIPCILRPVKTLKTG